MYIQKIYDNQIVMHELVKAHELDDDMHKLVKCFTYTDLLLHLPMNVQLTMMAKSHR